MKVYLILLSILLLISSVSAQITDKEPIDVFKDKTELTVSKDVFATKVIDKRVYDITFDSGKVMRKHSTQDIVWDTPKKTSIKEPAITTYSGQDYKVIGLAVCIRSSYIYDDRGQKVFTECDVYKSQMRDVKNPKYNSKNPIDKDGQNVSEYIKVDALNFTIGANNMIVVQSGKDLDPIIGNMTEGLLEYYEINDVFATDDEFKTNVTGGNNLTNGGCSLTPSGFIGSAWDCGGFNAEVELAGSSRYSLGQNMTFCQWVRNDGTPCGGGACDRGSIMMAYKDDSDLSRFYWEYILNRVDVHWRMDDSFFLGLGQKDINLLNKWVFACNQYNTNGTIKIWINGTLINQTYTNISGVSGAYEIIYLSNHNDYYEMNGRIDQMGIWNTILNDDEIEWLYNNHSGRMYADLLTKTGCIPSYTYTVWTNWTNRTDGSCYYIQNSSRVYYDENDCGAENITYWRNKTINVSNNLQDLDGVLCNDTCYQCDGLGACVVQANGTDLFNQCGPHNCSGGDTPYYWGWSGLECFSMNDTQGFCDGIDSCRSYGYECNNSIQGPTTGIIANCSDAQVNCTWLWVGVNNDTACVGNCSSQWNYTVWTNQDLCNYSNVILQNRTAYDLCGNWSNVTEYQDIGCDYCTQSITCSGWGLCNITQNNTCYDSNWNSCCFLSPLLSADCYRQDNYTYHTNYTLNQSCTNSTCATIQNIREENVKTAIIFLPIVLAGLLFWMAQSLNSEKHPQFKIFLTVLGMLMIFPALWFGVVSLNGTNTELIEAVASFIYIMSTMLFVICTYWIILYIKVGVATMVKNREEKLEY